MILLKFGVCSVLDIVGSALDIWLFERSRSYLLLRFIRLFIYLQDVIRKFVSQDADNKSRLNLAESRNLIMEIAVYRLKKESRDEII